MVRHMMKMVTLLLIVVNLVETVVVLNMMMGAANTVEVATQILVVSGEIKI